MKVLRRIFGSMDRQYMIRAYVIGSVFFVLLGLGIAGSTDGQNRMFVLVLMGINTLIFPFAKIVWDAFKGFVLGDTIIVQSVAVMFVTKYLVNGILWALAIFVAPIGVAYLLYKSRPHAS